MNSNIVDITGFHIFEYFILHNVVDFVHSVHYFQKTGIGRVTNGIDSMPGLKREMSLKLEKICNSVNSLSIH